MTDDSSSFFFVIIINVNMKALLLLKIINILANFFILSHTSLFMFHLKGNNAGARLMRVNFFAKKTLKNKHR